VVNDRVNQGGNPGIELQPVMVSLRKAGARRLCRPRGMERARHRIPGPQGNRRLEDLAWRRRNNRARSSGGLWSQSGARRPPGERTEPCFDCSQDVDVFTSSAGAAPRASRIALGVGVPAVPRPGIGTDLQGHANRGKLAVEVEVPVHHHQL